MIGPGVAERLPQARWVEYSRPEPKAIGALLTYPWVGLHDQVWVGSAVEIFSVGQSVTGPWFSPGGRGSP